MQEVTVFTKGNNYSSTSEKFRLPKVSIYWLLQHSIYIKSSIKINSFFVVWSLYSEINNNIRRCSRIDRI